MENLLKPKVLSHLVFDIETDGLLPSMAKIHCLCINDGVTIDKYGPQDILVGVNRLHNSDERLCGHNVIAFDIPAIQKLYPWFKPKQLPLDTKVWSQMATPDLYDLTMKTPEWRRNVPPELTLSHSLKAWGYRLGILKGTTPDETWATYSPEMLEYCAQDTVVTMALLRELEQWTTSMSAVDLEMQVAGILVGQERNGINFDTKAAERLSVRLLDELDSINRELRVVFPSWQKLRKRAISKVNNKKLGRTKGAEYEVWDTIEFNPNSNAHIVHVLGKKYGWQPEVFTDKGNPQLDDEILKDLESLGTMPEVALVRRYKTATKLYGYVTNGNNSWLNHVTPAGKIHGNVQVCGAGTRRMTHNSPNLGQVPSSRAYLGKECRSLFGPPPGYTMVGIDADQLELRTLSHYLYPYDNGMYVRAAIHGTKEDKTDIHWCNARAIGVDRETGKTTFYAEIYGAGVEKLGRTVTKSWDKQLNIRQGSRIKRNLRKGLPALAELKRILIETYKKRGHLLDLDGQMFRLRSEHSALNELNQRAGAILMKRAEVYLDEQLRKQGVDFKWLLHVHDEWQLAVRPHQVELVKQLATEAFKYATEYYGMKCPITGAAQQGDTWADTH